MVEEIQQQIVELENKIQALDKEREIFSKQLNHLKKLSSKNTSTSVTQYSSSTEKIHLFKNLFKGREDVYPKYWESAKTGKSGYSPVCGNEWKTGLCDKPRVKCSVCTNRSYLPVTDQVIQNHLSGIDSHNSYSANFVIGVYPLLTDERCWFDEQPTIQKVYAVLIEDEERNRVIIEDLKKLLKEKRSPLILTERKAHVTLLAEKISSFCNNVVVLQGGTGQKQRKQIMERLKNIPDNEEHVLISTGRYLGEGFDDARLDTLQLVMPVSWKGTLTQYVGRLHRLHHSKTKVLIYDYVDEVQMLVRMSEKRVSGYKSLGYSISVGQK